MHAELVFLKFPVPTMGGKRIPIKIHIRVGYFSTVVAIFSSSLHSITITSRKAKLKLYSISNINWILGSVH